MARVIERADQLVLEYVSKVADAAHGVLRTDQRLDFVQRLRARIEEERRGSDDLATVRKVLARFGDPAVLLQREVQRLAAGEQEAARRAPAAPGAGRVRGAGRQPASRPSSSAITSTPSPSPGRATSGSPAVPGLGSDRGARAVPGTAVPDEASTSVLPAVPASGSPVGDDFGDSATEVLPAVVDDGPPRSPAPPSRPSRPSRPVRPLPRGAAPVTRRVSPAPAPDDVSSPLLSRLGRAAMAGANPRAADGRDARTILANDRREVAGMALLLLAGLLVPLPLPYVAIFPIPVLVWALGALTVLACDGWVFKDRLTGLSAPIVAYVAGGAVLAAIRAPEAPGDGLAAFVSSFWHVSGLMFMLGAGGGVAWLAYRLFNPPPPPPRRQPLGIVR
ncbi:hypothetical protein [Sphaerisporangium perillae]|uniref:hypothetical protein n=1 Tax=Sphaerisporangium perillae TaxID=2935860 RepID=UPI00200F61B4|nr:hypothetical protein [Sphaerisporangium perillae]